MMRRLDLLCHAATSATRAHAFPGDEPLELRAFDELSRLSGWRRPVRCWVSPALAALQTAETLDIEGEAVPLLRECDYGRWRGLPLQSVEAHEPEALAEWLADPEAAPHGGESIAAVIRRIGGWLETQAPGAAKLTAITHASAIRAAVISAIGAPADCFWRLDVAPLSLTRLTFDGRRWRLNVMGQCLT